MKAYIEISALFERHWTGIPVVTASLVQHAQADRDIEWRFLYQSIALPDDIVQQLMSDRSDRHAREMLEKRITHLAPVGYREAGEGKAVFTTIKTVRGLFKEEALIVYDLSPLLTPQFHHANTIAHFGDRFRSDVETSSYFFPISRATQGDLETYFNVPQDCMTVMPMGVDLKIDDISLAQCFAQHEAIEPYVVVLGTLEPRKNGRLILDYIARNPGFAHRYRIVFVGREGWLDEKERLLEEIQRAGVHRDRVIFTGFVSEREKTVLLFNAAFCIYASLFEGYGLPILEASILGKLILCSNTSSMPEVAPQSCIFFDPSSVVDFAKAVSVAEKRAPQLATNLSLEGISTILEEHSWSRAYGKLREWAMS